MSLPFFKQIITTPIGEMVAVASSKALYLLEFADRKEVAQEIIDLQKEFEGIITESTNSILKQLVYELAAYFSGQLTQFRTPLHLNGTEFQCSVWRSLLKIPYGAMESYKTQSITLGNVKAIRAVASANGKNKLAIIIPCHRIIGSNGSLTGYAGGIERKRFLLNLERKHAGVKDLFSS